jgi:PAS domain S-box-containing protein
MPNAISVVQKSRKATYGAVGAPLSWSKLLNVIEAAADAIIAVDGDQRIVVCNRAAVSMFGYTRSEMVDQPFSLLLPERTHAEYWAYLNQEQQVHRAETIIGTPSIVRCKRKSGAEFDAEVARNLGDKRTRSGSTIILRDVTSRDTAERLDAHHRTIVSTLAEAVISIDAKGCIETWNESAEKITGYLKSEVIGQAIENVALFSPCPIAMARGTGSPQRIEGPLTAKSGKTVEVAVTATPMFTPQQRFLGVSAIITDISLRRQREEHMRFVMMELSHRAKNLMAVVVSMAQCTAGTCDTIEDYEQRFSSRVQSLAHSHDLLLREQWAGASLKPLVQTQLKSFILQSAHRITVEGPSVQLKPQAAQMIGLAFHELATNASKHGALSVQKGRLHVSWRILDGEPGERRLLLEWREIDGPPVTAPDRQGFGSMVIGDLVGRTLDAEVGIHFEPSGFHWTVNAPESYWTVSDTGEEN